MERTAASLASAMEAARAGSLEQWVHSFLRGEGDNPAFSDGLRLEPRRYWGPLTLPFNLFRRCCGPEPDNAFVVDAVAFNRHVETLRARRLAGWDMPPLILQYRDGEFVLNDGNHRFEALRRSGADRYWAVVWTTGDADAQDFSSRYAAGSLQAGVRSEADG